MGTRQGSGRTQVRSRILEFAWFGQPSRRRGDGTKEFVNPLFPRYDSSDSVTSARLRAYFDGLQMNIARATCFFLLLSLFFATPSTGANEARSIDLQNLVRLALEHNLEIL